MNTKTQVALERDIINRLESIIFHMEEIEVYANQLPAYNRSDCEDAKSPKHSDIRKLLTRIQNNEIDALYELVHFADNAKKYFKVSGLDLNKICEIEKNTSFRVAANFVNVHKHGMRGRNAKSAKLDFYYLVYKQIADEKTKHEQLFVVVSVVNYDGRLYPIIDLIFDLAEMWYCVVHNSCKMNLGSVGERISRLEAKLRYISNYSEIFLKHMSKEAVSSAQERKSLDV